MPSASNPYATPRSAGHQRDKAESLESRGGWIRWAAVYLFPVWMLLSFYFTWLVAWGELGHRPVPMKDDPKYIGGLMSVFQYLPGLFVMIAPAALPIGLVASFFCPRRPRNTMARIGHGILLALLYIGLTTAVIVTLRTDSGRIVEWWFD